MICKKNVVWLDLDTEAYCLDGNFRIPRLRVAEEPDLAKSMIECGDKNMKKTS